MSTWSSSTSAARPSSASVYALDPARQARHDRFARHPLGPARPAPRLLEEPPDPRHEPRLDRRAQDRPRPRRPGKAAAGRRPRVSLEDARAAVQHVLDRKNRGRSSWSRDAREPSRARRAPPTRRRGRRRRPAPAHVRRAGRARDRASPGASLGSASPEPTACSSFSATASSTSSRTGRSRSSAPSPSPSNFRLAANELRYVLGDSGARLALFEDSTSGPLLEAAAGTAARLVFVGERFAGGTPGVRRRSDVRRSAHRGNAVVPAAPPGENDLSLILYTSGTTGRPKGVPRTHKNHYAGAMAHVIQCGYAWGERTLGVMPLYHTMGIHALTSMAAINGCFVCQPDWSSAGALELIASERLTALYLIPTLVLGADARARAAPGPMSRPCASSRTRARRCWRRSPRRARRRSAPTCS